MSLLCLSFNPRSPQWGCAPFRVIYLSMNTTLPPKINSINSHYICLWKGHGSHSLPLSSVILFAYVTPIFSSAPPSFFLHCIVPQWLSCEYSNYSDVCLTFKWAVEDIVICLPLWHLVSINQCSTPPPPPPSPEQDARLRLDWWNVFCVCVFVCVCVCARVCVCLYVKRGKEMVRGNYHGYRLWLE